MDDLTKLEPGFSGAFQMAVAENNKAIALNNLALVGAELAKQFTRYVDSQVATAEAMRNPLTTALTQMQSMMEMAQRDLNDTIDVEEVIDEFEEFEKLARQQSEEDEVSWADPGLGSLDLIDDLSKHLGLDRKPDGDKGIVPE